MESFIKQHYTIKFYIWLSKSSSEIMFQHAFVDNCQSNSRVKTSTRFLRKEAVRSGHPSTSQTHVHVQLIATVEYRYAKMRKDCAKLVSRVLSEDQKKKTTECSDVKNCYNCAKSVDPEFYIFLFFFVFSFF